MREIITLNPVGNNSIELDERVKYNVEYFNFDIPLNLTSKKQRIIATRGVSAVILNDGDMWVKVTLYYSDMTGQVGNVNTQDVVLAPYQFILVENFPVRYIDIEPATEVPQSPYAVSRIVIRGLQHGLFPTFGRVSTDYKVKLLAFDLVRSAINVNANSSQTINVNYITPLKGKLKFLIFPSAPVTASVSITDVITNTTFSVNINNGNSVYGEYEMDISKFMLINSITLTNNNSSSVSGYLVLIYEVG